jgi:hypothetical protein
MLFSQATRFSSWLEGGVLIGLSETGVWKWIMYFAGLHSIARKCEMGGLLPGVCAEANPFGLGRGGTEGGAVLYHLYLKKK